MHTQTTMSTSRKQLWQVILLLGMLLAVLALVQVEQQTQVLLKIRFRYKWLFVMGFFALAFVLQGWLLLKPGLMDVFARRIMPAAAPTWPRRLLGGTLFLVGLPLIWLAKFSHAGDMQPILGISLFAAWCLLLLQALGLQWAAGLSWELAFVAAVLADGLLFQIYSIFQPVTQYPFSLGWSEASRYFYGSLPFSRSLYGESLPLSFLHGSRYLMLSIPFLVQGLPLWAERLWQSLLWLGVTGLTAWAAARRLPGAARWLRWLLGAWLFLFFFQGVVYYHLQVSVLIILLGVSMQRKGWSLFAVLLASFWAGMSRVNWFPVPAMLAIALYLLEQPLSAAGSLWRYLARPALWAAAGILSAFLGQAFYIWVSGNSDLAVFGSSFSSDLLWYRLLPNATYGPGVILGIFIVSLPSALFLYWALRGRVFVLHPIRLLGLAAMLLVLFAGGLVVSTKIGGGGDLHNMDAYLVLLSLIIMYFAAHAVRDEAGGPLPAQQPPWSLLLLLAIVPVGLTFFKLSPPIRYDRAQAARDLSELGQAAELHSHSGPVLFIYERHLLTFNMVPEIPLVNDYEVLTLMEMAISGNQPYLDRFYHDLESHRFAAIVMRRSNLAVNAGDFLEENNAWNKLVAYPLYCEYRPELSLGSSSIELYVPRSQRECPVAAHEGTQP
jgi:hypothetical protein